MISFKILSKFLSLTALDFNDDHQLGLRKGGRYIQTPFVKLTSMQLVGESTVATSVALDAIFKLENVDC